MDDLVLFVRSLWYALQELPFGPQIVGLGLLEKIVVGVRLGSLQRYAESATGFVLSIFVF